MIVNNKKLRHSYQEAGKISTEIMFQLYEQIRVGIYPIELDEMAKQLCIRYQVEPAFYAVPGRKGIYGYHTCIQLNDVAVHGIPSQTEIIKEGDLVTIDFGIKYQGLNTDHCFTVGIEPVAKGDFNLLKVGHDSVLKAARAAKTGAYTGDLGYIMHSEAQKHGFDTLKNYIGHGIGKTLHEDPELPAFGEPNTGEILQKGMVICVESQVVAGSDQIKIDADTWTARTKDGQNSVMFEFMVLVDNLKPQILTPTYNLPLTKK